MDVDAGQGTLLLGRFLLVPCIMGERVRDQSAANRGSQVPDCP